MTGNYDDIRGLPRHVSKTRPQMAASSRAAQFSPFAALAGYDAAVKETARLTDERLEIDESMKGMLNEKLQMIAFHDKKEEVTITYFQPDERKAGGRYVSVKGKVKKIDDYERQVVMVEGTVIPMDEMVAIDGPIFDSILLPSIEENED